MSSYHEAVLTKQSINGLIVDPNGIYVDATYGGGTHSTAILKNLNKGKLFAFDRDSDAIKNKISDNRLTIINQNYRYLKNFLRLYEVTKIDGLLADLGISSYQIDTAERGFSTRFEGELDMRMDRRKKLTAKEIINKYDSEKLTEIFRHYGEIKNAAKISRVIVEHRKEQKINTTLELTDLLSPYASKPIKSKYYAKVFQALRIEVNQEIESLKELLLQSNKTLKSKGRLVVITYHSIEDRIVKNFMRSGNFTGKVEKDFYGNPLSPFVQINKKGTIPEQEEIDNNNRARSARLRIAEKI